MPPPQPTGSAHQKATFTASSGVSDTAQKIVVYGPGGIGKSKLASLVKQLGLRPIFLDVENGSNFLDVDRVSPCPDNFQMLRDALQTPELFEDRDVVAAVAKHRRQDRRMGRVKKRIRADQIGDPVQRRWRKQDRPQHRSLRFERLREGASSHRSPQTAKTSRARPLAAPPRRFRDPPKG